MTSKTYSKKAAGAGDDSAADARDAATAFVKAGTENYEKAFATARQRMDEAVKSYDELNAFGKGNVEAMVAASGAYARGCEQISTELMAFGKQSVEEGITAAKAMFGARTVQDVVDLQTSFAKSWLDSWVGQSTKLGELTTKVVQESAEPINHRLSLAVDRWAKPAL